MKKLRGILFAYDDVRSAYLLPEKEKKYTILLERLETRFGLNAPKHQYSQLIQSVYSHNFEHKRSWFYSCLMQRVFIQQINVNRRCEKDVYNNKQRLLLLIQLVYRDVLPLSVLPCFYRLSSNCKRSSILWVNAACRALSSIYLCGSSSINHLAFLFHSQGISHNNGRLFLTFLVL